MQLGRRSPRRAARDTRSSGGTCGSTRATGRWRCERSTRRRRSTTSAALAALVRALALAAARDAPRRTSRARRSAGRASARRATASTARSSTAAALRPLADVARETVARVRPFARELGDEDALDGIERILGRAGARAASGVRMRWAASTKCSRRSSRTRAARRGRSRRRARRLAAAERRAQRCEVPAHHAEVVVAAGSVLVRQPFQRIEHRGPRAGLPRHRLGELRRDERLEEDGRGALAPDPLDERLQAPRARLRLRAEARERDLLEAVGLREVPERRVARDDLASLAVREPLAELAVEPPEPGDEPIGGRRVAQRRGNAACQRGVAARIQPDVRVAVDAGTPARRSTAFDRPGTASSSDGMKPPPRYRTRRASRSPATSRGESSRSCGSAPGGVRLRTSASGATCSARTRAGRRPRRPRRPLPSRHRLRRSPSPRLRPRRGKR